jgi:hypothetical protein
MGKLEIDCDVGEVSDGYHTFNELYAHRCALFSALMKSHPTGSWKSLTHDDGSKFDGWFIAGMELPNGPISYHLPINQFWDKLHDIVELEKAPKWGGYTSNDVLLRLLEWINV